MGIENTAWFSPLPDFSNESDIEAEVREFEGDGFKNMPLVAEYETTSGVPIRTTTTRQVLEKYLSDLIAS